MTCGPPLVPEPGVENPWFKQQHFVQFGDVYPGKGIVALLLLCRPLLFYTSISHSRRCRFCLWNSAQGWRSLVHTCSVSSSCFSTSTLTWSRSDSESAPNLTARSTSFSIIIVAIIVFVILWVDVFLPSVWRRSDSFIACFSAQTLEVA